MMRTIKFRGWDKYSKKWIDFTLEDLMIAEFSDTYYLEHWSEWTGLKDSKGVEIYEGDIVVAQDMVQRGDGSYDPAIGPVEWSDESACFMMDFPCAQTEGFYADLEIEVIGNIHENPELLNE
jgi:uncharacterized phage protein (TIGR01671 family)